MVSSIFFGAEGSDTILCIYSLSALPSEKQIIKNFGLLLELSNYTMEGGRFELTKLVN